MAKPRTATVRPAARRVLVKGYVLPGLKAELADEAERSGKSASTIIEDALRSHLAWLRQVEAGSVRRAI